MEKTNIVIPLSSDFPDKKKWRKGMRIQTYMFGWVTLVHFSSRTCVLKLDEPLEDGSMAVYVSCHSLIKRVPKPVKASGITAKTFSISVERDLKEREEKYRLKWERDREYAVAACMSYGMTFPTVWLKSWRKFAQWCTDQIKAYECVIDTDNLLRYDTSVFSGKGVDDLCFVPDVDVTSKYLTRKWKRVKTFEHNTDKINSWRAMATAVLKEREKKRSIMKASVKRCAVMPRNIITAINNSSRPMDKALAMWHNSYYIKMRKFGRTFNVCCDGSKTRDEAFVWYKDLTIQYMEDLITYYGIKPRTLVRRKLEHIASVYRKLEDMDAEPDISASDEDLDPGYFFERKGEDLWKE